MISETCIDYRPGGQSFVAFFSGESQTALSFFPGTTWKKKTVAQYLRIADLLGIALPGVFFRPDIELFGTTIKALRQILQEKYAIRTRSFLLMHNREYKRQRAYLWCIDDSKKLIAFVKIGLGEDNYIDFQREANALLAVDNMEIDFNSPKLLGFFQQDEMTVLVVSPLPFYGINFYYLPWNYIEKHLIKLKQKTMRKIHGAQLPNLDWYAKFFSSLQPETAKAIETFFSHKHVNVSFIHGDMGSENVFIFKEKLWVVDWEKSTLDGPIATDEIAHWLGKTVDSQGLNKQLINLFNEVFGDGGKSNPDIFLALCYLKSVHFPPGEFVFDDFERTILSK